MKIDIEIYKHLSLEQFTAFDVETTGLDPKKDEIIEFGIVKVKNGKVIDEYTQLFNPGIPIPEFIVNLTGISNEECTGKPEIRDKLPEIIDFLGNDYILAHNSEFDLSFLNTALKKYLPGRKPISKNLILDTLDLSRLLLYYLPNHKLQTLADHFNIISANKHRAFDDARTTALIFNNLLKLCLELNKRTINIVCDLMKDTHEGIENFFKELRVYINKYGSEHKLIRKRKQDNIIGKYNAHEENDSPAIIEKEDIDSFLSPTGALSNYLPDFEYREQQHEMADSVRQAFNQNAFLVAEAGTGIGKSLAYLIPSLLLVNSNPESKVVISTNTKNLQDQLFNKELPLLQNISKLKFFAVLLKGRGNYICQLEWEDMLVNPGDKFSYKDRKKILPLVIWADETRTGDIEENSGFSRKWNSFIWSKFSCENLKCRSKDCEFESSCFLNRIRKASRNADIVIVNHSLLFSDVSSGNSILRGYDTLVIDEAHNIENSATNCLNLELNLRMFKNLTAKIYQDHPNKNGIFVSILRKLKSVLKEKMDQQAIERIISDLTVQNKNLYDKTADFYNNMISSISVSNDKHKYQKKRFKSAEQLFGPLMDNALNIESDLDQFFNNFSHLIRLMQDMEYTSEKEFYKWNTELGSILQQIEKIKILITHFLKNDYNKNIVWVEIKVVHNRKYLHFYSVPLDISKILKDNLYTNINRAILTSATLSVNKTFDYFIDRVGLADIASDRLTVKSFGSPFNYSEQSLFVIPDYLADPRQNDFSTDVSNLINDLLSVNSCGTMVLFTSYKMLKDVYRALHPDLKNNGVLLLGQGIDGTRAAILDLFQKNEKSVLLGTNSFWEGVDIPGSALEMLVITKIPFQVPTDPIFEARREKVEKDSGNGFINYAVPEAVIKFRQGVGRLIRSRNDRGVILLLDQRLIKTRYGKFFLNSLPADPEVCSDEYCLKEKINNWFK